MKTMRTSLGLERSFAAQESIRRRKTSIAVRIGRACDLRAAFMLRNAPP
jgi:hypothetical protein